MAIVARSPQRLGPGRASHQWNTSAVAVALVFVVGLAIWITWMCTRPGPPASAERLRARAELDACIGAETYGQTWETKQILGHRPDDRVVLCLAGEVTPVYHRVGGVDFELCAASGGQPPITWMECWTVTWAEPLRFGDFVTVIGVAMRAERPAGAPDDSYWLEPFVDALAVRVSPGPPLVRSVGRFGTRAPDESDDRASDQIRDADGASRDLLAKHGCDDRDDRCTGRTAAQDTNERMT